MTARPGPVSPARQVRLTTAPILSLIARLYVLIAVALLPAIAILIGNELVLRAEREARARSEALRLAQFVASEMDRLIEGGRALLQTAAQLPRVRSAEPAACGEIVGELIAPFPRFASMIVVGAGGSVLCAADKLPGAGLTQIDRTWLTAALRRQAFTVGAYRLPEGQSVPVLVLSLPFRGASGELAGVVALGVDIERLRREIAARPLPAGGSVSILDREGVILIRSPNPELVGGTLPAAFRWMLDAVEPGTTEGMGLDGVTRIGGYVPPARTSGLLVTVALARDEALAGVDAASRRGMALILIGTALAALTAWIGGQRFIRQPVQRLIEAAERVTRGEPPGALGAIRGTELATLAHSFERMARTLQVREEQLTESEARLRRAIEGAVVPILFHAEDGEILAVSDGLLRITGYRREQLHRHADWARLAYRERAAELAALIERRFAGIRFPAAEQAVHVADGGTRVWRIDTAPPERLGDGRLCLFEIMSDVTELRLHEAALQLGEQRLRLALAAGRMSVWSWPPGAQEVDWADALTSQLRLSAESPPASAFALLHAEDGEAVRAGLEAARTRRTGWQAEFRAMQPDGGVVWLSARGNVVAESDAEDDPGQASGPAMVGVMWDISLRKQAEQRQQLLVAELDHRVKNVLTVVQSIAALSMRHVDTLAAFQASFTGRLHALSLAHDALARRRWEGVDLASLITATLAPYDLARVTIAVPALVLPAAQAQPLALALHELATNAAKHGALASPTGRLALAGTITDGRLTLVWSETGGPPVWRPERQGFGTALITHMLPQQTGGEVLMDWRPSGLVCRMVIPQETTPPAA